MKPEVKYYTSNFGTPGTGLLFDNANPINVLLNGLPVGADQSQRLGSKIRNRFLEFRCLLEYINGTQSQSNVRVVIYIDKMPRGQMRRIMGSSTPYTSSMYEFVDRDHNAFKVLFDKTYKVESGGSGITSANVICKKKLNFVTDCSRNNGNTITAFEQGALYVKIFTDNGLGNSIRCWGHWNLAYSDA